MFEFLFGAKPKKTGGAYEPEWVTESLAVGPAPLSYRQLDALKSQGVGAILNLCAEFSDLHEIEAEHGFDVFHLPTVDEEAPDLEKLDEALAWLDEAVYLGKKVLIHCRHGIGRTGTALNAYLLRRGLSPREADKIVKKVRSRPANYDQWRAVRAYGKASPKLTIREPSLETKHSVDLGPFFDDYRMLVARVEDLVQLETPAEERGRCGGAHALCCTRPIRLSLMEAVLLSHSLNTELASGQREAVILKAAMVARAEAEAARAQGATEGEACLTDAGTLCPLLSPKKVCLLFEHRPLICRSFELSHGAEEETLAVELWEDVLDPALETLSRQLYLAYNAVFPEFPFSELTFALPEVVSGRYVQKLFALMLDSRKARAAGRTA